MPFMNPEPVPFGFTEAVQIPFLYRPSEYAIIRRIPNPEDQIYSWHHTHSPIGYHFHIKSLKQLALDHHCPTQTIRLTQAEAGGAIKHSNVEQHHVMRLLTNPAYLAYLDEPGLIVELPPSVLPAGLMADPVQMVDGNHRLVARVIRGDKRMTMYRVPEPVWKLALLDLPDELGKTFLPPMS